MNSIMLLISSVDLNSSSILQENGYQLIFLSARAISQAHITRQFLLNLKQVICASLMLFLYQTVESRNSKVLFSLHLFFV